MALLAIVGFAAFGNPNPTSQEVRVEAAAASMGHTSGAYAGLAFALLGGTDDSVDSAADEPDINTRQEARETASAEAAVEDTKAVDPPATGWLSEVEVRALVSLYFQPEDVNKAVRITWCESRFDPNSVDLRTGAVGLFQHLPRYWADRAANAGFTGYEPTNPEASTAAAAWEVYEGGGWEVFACRG